MFYISLHVFYWKKWWVCPGLLTKGISLGAPFARAKVFNKAGSYFPSIYIYDFGLILPVGKHLQKGIKNVLGSLLKKHGQSWIKILLQEGSFVELCLLRSWEVASMFCSLFLQPEHTPVPERIFLQTESSVSQ